MSVNRIPLSNVLRKDGDHQATAFEQAVWRSWDVINGPHRWSRLVLHRPFPRGDVFLDAIRAASPMGEPELLASGGTPEALGKLIRAALLQRRA